MNNLFETYHIDSGAPGPDLLITAGVHGDEYEPMLAAQRLVETLAGLIQAGSVTIVPVVNRSAYQLACRCGEDGKDLARSCPGSPDGTITEQVAFQISELIRKTSYYIDMHTGGKIFDIFPLTGYMLHDSPEVLEVQRNMAQAFGLPVIWGTDPFAEGRTLSVARDADVPAIYVEFGGPSPVNSNIVRQYVTGCLNVLASFAMLKQNSTESKPSSGTQGFSPNKNATKSKPSSLTQGFSPGTAPGAATASAEALVTAYWVEDHRRNNGHLQSKTPAHAEGIFLPELQAGTKVKGGETWGMIIDAISGEQTRVIVESAGIVLFTRTSGFVKKGDSLGGLLPITEPGKIVFDEQ